MTAQELREKFLKFFESKGHKIIPSASLIPENDPTVLFTTAGMHPLVPYLMGEKHPEGKRLTNLQRCVRTGDIDEVGDESHLTFFEMMGYWSLGDYWKKEAIEYIFEFLAKELGLDPKKFAATCYEGDEKNNIPRDTEAYDVWRSLEIPEERIAYLGYEDNWWGPAGVTGPCGPDSELFVWVGEGEAPAKFDPEDKGWMELCNDVFMQYNKTVDGKFKPLVQKNVDFGMGFERLLAYLNHESDIYKTELFWPMIEKIEELSGLKYGNEPDEYYINKGQQCWVDVRRSFRIISDHFKAAVNIASEGINPSNVGQGYVLRKLIRRAFRYSKFIKIDDCGELVELIGGGNKAGRIVLEEIEKFKKALEDGLKKAEKIFSTKKIIPGEIYSKIMQLENKSNILGDIYDNKKNGHELSKFDINVSDEDIISAYVTGKEAFDLYQSYGFPIEMITDLTQEKGIFVDITGFREEMKLHQDLSRTASAGMFKGGLADAGEETKKLHTAAHLMLEALRRVLGGHVVQRGSNITAERLRFDFSHSEKMTSEQVAEVEKIVNEQIEKDLPVMMEEMTVEEAEKKGAMGVFKDRYGERVKVYTIGDTTKGEVYSCEICGGPHIEHTGELGKFKIKKEESSSAGVRRIKAILE